MALRLTRPARDSFGYTHAHVFKICGSAELVQALDMNMLVRFVLRIKPFSLMASSKLSLIYLGLYGT